MADVSSVQKVKGQRYRVLADKANKIWKELSFKTAAEDVYFNDTESEALSSIIGYTYTKTLYAGRADLSFSISSLSNESRVEVYTNDSSVVPTSITVSGTALTVTFAPQNKNIIVKVIVGSFVDASGNY